MDDALNTAWGPLSIKGINFRRKEKVKEKLHRLQAAEMQNQLNELPGGPVTCKIFGCGQILSLREQLHGDTCIIHNQKNSFDSDNHYFWLMVSRYL